MVVRSVVLAAAIGLTCCSTSHGQKTAPPLQEVRAEVSPVDSGVTDVSGPPSEVLVDLADRALDVAPRLPDVLSDVADVTQDVAEPLPPYEPTEFVGTDGRNFRDAEGRVLILHGVNVSNVSKGSPFFPEWFTEPDAQDLADRGLNVVRFLIIWEAIEPAKGEFDHEYLDMVEEKVAWFTSRGIYVLVDMHQDVYGPKFGGDGAPLWATLDHDIPFDPPPGTGSSSMVSPRSSRPSSHSGTTRREFGITSSWPGRRSPSALPAIQWSSATTSSMSRTSATGTSWTFPNSRPRY